MRSPKVRYQTERLKRDIEKRRLDYRYKKMLLHPLAREK